MEKRSILENTNGNTYGLLGHGDACSLALLGVWNRNQE